MNGEILVVDANVAIPASFDRSVLDDLGEARLVAPRLMWSEALAALHAALWRGAIDASDAGLARAGMDKLEIERRDDGRLAAEAWAVAEELGWAKTYDAEYVALARLLGGRVLTLDLRLRRGADRLGLVVTPEELLT